MEGSRTGISSAVPAGRRGGIAVTVLNAVVLSQFDSRNGSFGWGWPCDRDGFLFEALMRMAVRKFFLSALRHDCLKDSRKALCAECCFRRNMEDSEWYFSVDERLRNHCGNNGHPGSGLSFP